MSIPVRVEIPAREGLEGCVPEKLRLDSAQAHGLTVQLEEQGFGYGAFWCQPPTIREALWILRCAIWKREPRTSKTPSMANKAPSLVPWLYGDDYRDAWTEERNAYQSSE